MTSDWQVLVVEDEFDSAEMVSKILTFHGITVYHASNGVEALEMLNDFEPTAIVMDLAMPQMDGWQTLMAIRASADHAHIPVIAVTAFDSVGVAEDAYKAGFDGYFPKPLNPVHFVDNLVDIVNNL